MKELRSAEATTGSLSNSGIVSSLAGDAGEVGAVGIDLLPVVPRSERPPATHQGEQTPREWCIRIGEVFDFDAALECLRQCREDRHFLPDHLRFDLTRTRQLSTAGIGVMLHIRSDYQLAPGHAVIEYLDPQVGEMLLLSGMHRTFLIQHRDAARLLPA